MIEAHVSAELVPAVPPLSTLAIVERAEWLVGCVSPARLRTPGRIDAPLLVDYELPRMGVLVYPEDDSILGSCEGQTRWANDCVEITLCAGHYDAIFDGGIGYVRAVSTLCHECGHAFLHYPVLQRFAELGFEQRLEVQALHRRRRDLPVYCHPEWQAWVFCGAMLMPRPVLRQMDGWNVAAVADAQGVSTALVRKHVRRMQREGFRIERGVLRAA